MRLKLYTLAVISILSFSFELSAQKETFVINIVDGNNEVRERLRLMKLSNEYYYYDAVGGDLQRSEEDALQLLELYVMQRFDSASMNIAEILRLNAKTDYYIKSDRYYVSAYVSKSHFINQSIDVEPNEEFKSMTLSDSLSMCNDFQELNFKLQKLHESNRVMYGRMDKILNLEPCYVVVFDNRGKITAFLEPGTDSRVDLKSGKRVVLSTFNENLKLWIILY